MKRFSARSLLVLALVVVGASGIAYGVVYGLNNALAANNAASEYQHFNGEHYRERFWPGRHNTTSSFRAISRVDSVSVTGFSIVNSNQISVSLSYTGTGSAPAITIVGVAPGLSGSGILATGWASPATVTVSLVGTGTLSTTWHVAVLIVPFTGA